MTYVDTLDYSPLAFGKIKCTYAVLYNYSDNRQAFSLQRLLSKAAKKRKVTVGFTGVAVCTLGAEQPLKDNSLITAILTEDAVTYINALDKKAAARLAKDNYMVRVKPIAFDWTACDSETTIGMLPLMDIAEEESIVTMIQENEGTVQTTTQKKTTTKRNLGLVAAALSLFLNN
jgi:hypothetical protein